MKAGQNKDRNKKLKLAVPKGRILKEGLDLLRKAGYIKHPDSAYDSRKLIFDYKEDGVSLLIVKPWDVPTFVEYGAADAGISGKDVLLENPMNVYEPLDLGIGRCKIVVAAPKSIMLEIARDIYSNAYDISGPNGTANLLDIVGEDASTVMDGSIITAPSGEQVMVAEIKGRIYRAKTNLRVATKYVRITKDFFNKKGVTNVQIIKMYGNVELAPLSGLADLIVDLVSTGETLRQNNLVPIENIASVTSRLIVNRASLKINSGQIATLIEKLKGQIEKDADA